MNFSVTIVFILIIAIVSIIAFNKREYIYRFQFNPYLVHHRKEYYRLLSHVLVHGDWMHLIFNMYVLYIFGAGSSMGGVENFFVISKGATGLLLYAFLFIGGAVFAGLPGMLKHKDNPGYNAIGASGAVSAVLFSSILFNPTQGIGFFLIPVFIPAWIFGLLYLALEYYLDKRSGDHIAHDAHFYGAIFGIIFTILVNPSIVPYFLDSVF